MTHKNHLDLYIEVDVLTAGTTAEVVIAILEALIYQRNQIPFVYKTYRYYVNRWLEHENKEPNISEAYTMQSFQVQRIKEEAITTKESISSMRQTIKNIFEKKPIKSLRFLFGSTVFTAKESYTIHVPTQNIALNHSHEHHKLSAGNLNQALLSLLTNENLYAIFAHNLNPTNIYLELELMNMDNCGLMFRKDPLKNAEIFPKDFLTLPASCKNIHINLFHKQSSSIQHEQLKCCKELEVFEDLTNLNLKCDSEEENLEESEKVLTNLTSGWWEAKIFVRGFKDKPVKGFNIWS